jgi:ABC-type branched-subunit amino acid transport system ATPase component
MEVEVKNLGVLKEAKFTLGDLTIICGGNNTGKTYATYALFGFLYTWKQRFFIELKDDKIEQLLNDGVIRLDLQEYIKQVKQIVAKGCHDYTQRLPQIFAAPAELFKDTEFQVSIDIKNISFAERFERRIGSVNDQIFSILKIEESTELVIALIAEKDKGKIPKQIIKRIITAALKDIIFAEIIPRPFIASAERTGTAIFGKELNVARNRLLKEMGQANNNLNRMNLFLEVYQNYAMPIETNLDFTRKLESIVKKTSFIAENHPDVLTDFADILGGEYTVNRSDQLYYVPKGKRVKLSMDQSSSAVRSLLDIGFYLKHEAQIGDLLMVDEPELNLHPENQRRIARLFARLVNLGIKVFITTHSDYIIKELNTLIMLNHDKPHLKRIAEEEGYREVELISAEKIKVYIAEEAPILLEGKKRKTKYQTLTRANIDPEMGIEARSFDTTIETMNRIQEAIVWGKD